MNIKLLRMALCMNTATAARYLAARPDHPDGVSETTWVRWENGKKEIPADVLQHLQPIAEQLQHTLLNIVEINSLGENAPVIQYVDPANTDDMIAHHIDLARAVWANVLHMKVENKNG